MTTNKILCVICNKERGIFKCDGCSNNFCLSHTTNHHQDVLKQLDKIEEIRDSVQKTIVQESTELRRDIKILHEDLMKQIQQWEQDSIIKIQKAADETRNELFQCTLGRLTNIQFKFKQINNQLEEARKTNDFIETDLQQWEKKLNQLSEELNNPKKISIREDFSKFVSKIRLNLSDGKEIFERSTDNAQFEEDGKIVNVKIGSDIYTEVRGQHEYSDGQRTISFQIEKLNGWILFGIISKSTPLQIHSYVSPTCYGWYNGEGFVYVAGENIGGNGLQLIENDIVHLLIDCDNQFIQLTNQRTNQILSLRVAIDKCPFPWQIHLNLNLSPTRIRIL